MNNLSRSEQETHFNQTAEDRINGILHIYSDDPAWLKKIDALAQKSGGIECVGVESHGGKHYRVETSAVTLSLRPKRKVSDATRERMRELRKRQLG